ncbi:PepSY domain-containing protein [Streptomyces sp. NPDC014734]|uniref:PepSY domain-containing protein n=1 Tax=Streptomyces sp. NPDC014734 TaxID=3364886 RepID=UPI0036FD671A
MKRKIAIAAVAAAVLIGGGTATAVALTDVGGRDRAAARSGVPDDGADRVDVGDAVAAALKAVPGTVTEAELDDEDGGRVWELDVYGADRKWHGVTVDAGDGAVLGTRVPDDNDDRGRHAPRSAAVSLDAAVAAALAARPGTVTSVDLEDDHRVRGGAASHWEVEIRGGDGTRHELDVDAATAKVTADRPDDDHDDHDDHGDDRDDRDDD